LWESGKWVFDTLLAPDTIFDFASGGVSEFEILGINPGGDASNGNRLSHGFSSSATARLMVR
jgi:hypothetical protein